ncbi:MAG: nicotinate-nucleotide pyrophosphorylase [Bacillota bacterium]
MDDIRLKILGEHAGHPVRARLTATTPGVVAGTPEAIAACHTLGLTVHQSLPPGTAVTAGSVLLEVSGPALHVLAGEEVLAGCCGKASGVATAARWFVERAAGRAQVVCGAWKKYPLAMKDLLRAGIAAGGVSIRITQDPFIYLDKNYVRVLGGIREALEQAGPLLPRVPVIQVRGDWAPVPEEAELAARHGAGIIMVDNGCLRSAREAVSRLDQLGLRSRAKLAFGGGVDRDNFASALDTGVDIVEVGRAIIDASILDLRYDIVEGV